jgi:hypothetical protein
LNSFAAYQAAPKAELEFAAPWQITSSQLESGVHFRQHGVAGGIGSVETA